MNSTVATIAEGIAIINGILLIEVRGTQLARAALMLEKVTKLYAESVDELYEGGLKCHAQTVDLSFEECPRPSEPLGKSSTTPGPSTQTLAKKMWVPGLAKLDIFSRSLMRRQPAAVEIPPRAVFEEVVYKYLFCPSNYGFPTIFLVSEDALIDKDQFASNALRFSDEETSDSEGEEEGQNATRANEEEQSLESSSEEEFFDLYPPDYCEAQDDEEEQLFPAEFGYHFLAPLPEPEQVVKDSKRRERKKRVKKVLKSKQKEKIKRFKFMNLDVTQSKTEKLKSALDFDPGENIPCSSPHYDAEQDGFQSVENFEAPRRRIHKKRREVITNESGICMNHYRTKVLELFDNSRDGTVDFCQDFKFKGCRDVSLHLLAVLHLANENKVEIVTQPLTVNHLRIIRLEYS